MSVSLTLQGLRGVWNGPISSRTEFLAVCLDGAVLGCRLIGQELESVKFGGAHREAEAQGCILQSRKAGTAPPGGEVGDIVPDDRVRVPQFVPGQRQAMGG